jgi:hydrophobic/amphiphilic exporter-1 (mainly G- bacteria), HAE1 family
MAVAIIGGVITSTFLTLLVVPSFYDSIEVSRDRMLAKFRRREERWNAFSAFIVTFLEALATLVFLRAIWRLLARLVGFVRRGGRRAPPQPA